MRVGPDAQRGVGLVEILIAVVLVSIGFLAAARMQVQGMRFSQSAYFQSQAYFLAGDMIDRMRANARGVDDSAYDAVDTDEAVADPGCDTSTLCSPAQQAQQDIFDWRAHFVPDGSGSVVVLPGAGDVAAKGTVTARGAGRYEVTVTWSEVVDGENAAQSLSMFFVTETI